MRLRRLPLSSSGFCRSSRVIELFSRFKEAAGGGRLGVFLAQHQGALGARDLRELGGLEAFQQLWQPLAPRVRELIGQMLDPELSRLVRA